MQKTSSNDAESVEPTSSGEYKYSRAYQDKSAVDVYEKRYAEGSSDAMIWGMELQLLFKLLTKFCPDFSDAKTMDFACGTGRILSCLDGKVGTLVGVDISRQMLDQAKKNVPNVPTMCLDLNEEPEKIPAGQDIITLFRFILMADPDLREDCMALLATKLKDEKSILIVGLHGNPKSRRILAHFRNWLRGKPKLASFSLYEMRSLAERNGLVVVGGTGCGYIPLSVARYLPAKIVQLIEGGLAGRPWIWRYGSNLLVVCRKASNT